MSDKALKQNRQSAKNQRLAEALRANLKRRKTQSRQRSSPAGEKSGKND